MTELIIGFSIPLIVFGIIYYVFMIAMLNGGEFKERNLTKLQVVIYLLIPYSFAIRHIYKEFKMLVRDSLTQFGKLED